MGGAKGLKHFIGIVSLGCAKNLVDSEVMLGILKGEDYQVTNDESQADILIVNTCGFIESAKEESINTILELAEYKKTGNCKVLIMAGCLAQKYADELLEELPEVDAFVGTGEVGKIKDVVEGALAGNRILSKDIPEYLYDEHTPRVLTTPVYSAYVKIAEGCDNLCSYCVIPEMRGRYRSRSKESIVAEVKSLVDQGVREVLLIAQDTTKYGEDLYGHYALPELLEQLSTIKDLKWIRLLYCYPSHFTQELVDVMAKNDKVCNYLDIPLQHANDNLLRAMNRKSSIEEVRVLINKLRRAMPDIVLRTSFIVGLPGEGEKEFQDLLDFMEEIKFNKVGVFTYSQEPGTPAAELPDQVPEETKFERYRIAMESQQGISYNKNKEYIGKVLEILVEELIHEEAILISGRSYGDAPEIDGKVLASYAAGIQLGDFIKVKIIDAQEYDLIGEVLDESC